MENYPEGHIQKIHFEQFVDTFLVDFYEKPNPDDVEKIIQEIKILEKYSLGTNRFYCLFDHSKFYPAYVSANVEKEGGYSVDFMLNQGLFFLFQRLHWKQLLIPIKVSLWGPRFQKNVNHPLAMKKTKIYCCGVKFKDKWDKWRTILIKQQAVLFSKNNQLLLSFLEVEEITTIYKADFVWYRAAFSHEDIQINRVYFSSGTKKEQAELLSPRELEILRLAIEHKSNREIGQLLNISKNTVDRHRKNMIARVGATDMTALIRICQIAEVI